MKKNRPLRVLHLGNIANNAYLNAKFMRKLGIEADVLCYDYYHVLSTPEWEEADVELKISKDCLSFTKKMMRGYKRPSWFIQGPFLLCYYYLKSKRNNNKLRLYFFKFLLKFSTRNKKIVQFYYPLIYKILCMTGEIISAIFRIPRRFLKLLHFLIGGNYYLVKKNQINNFRCVNESTSDLFLDGNIETTVDEFSRLFPDRPDQLNPGDLLPYSKYVSYWSEIFDYYDIIEAYGTSPILPMLSGNKPYIAFEHGTLRVFTMGNNPLHRLTAMAYRKANWAFITNGDCLEYAHKLGMINFSPMIHPVNIDQHRFKYKNEIEMIRRKFNKKILLFCPLRHDWLVKGINIYIEALPLIKKEFSDDAIIIFTEWGGEVDKSRERIKELNCELMVVWLSPLPRIKMIQYMQAADIILDQLALPHFGSTAIQGLAVGTPVIMSYRPHSTQWIAAEPAPLIEAFSPQDIVNGINLGIDDIWKAEFKVKARQWVDTYHSISLVLNKHLEIYKNLIGE